MNFFAFFTYAVVTNITPGPNNIMAMSNAGQHGLKKSMRFNLGVFTGVAMVLLLSCFFSLALVQVLPAIKPVLSMAGAYYILFLAWKVYRSKPAKPGEKEALLGYWSGAFLQFLNPKGLIFGITVSSTFIVPYYRSAFVLAAFCLGLALLTLAATTLWALFGSAFRKLMVKHYRLINLILALSLVYCAVSLLL